MCAVSRLALSCHWKRGGDAHQYTMWTSQFPHFCCGCCAADVVTQTASWLLGRASEPWHAGRLEATKSKRAF